MTNHPNRSKQQQATTDDHVMRGYLDSQKKRRGWKTSGHIYNPNPTKARKSVEEFVVWMLANGGKRALT